MQDAAGGKKHQPFHEGVVPNVQQGAGDAQGSQILDQILRALRNAPEGLTRSEIGGVFGRHRSSEEIGTALRNLGERGLAGFQKEDTDGRSAERWFAVSKDARKARKERNGGNES